MNYQEFLQRFGSEDSPSLRQAWQEQFGIFDGANNLGLGPQVELADRGVHGRVMSNPNEILYGTEGQEGRNFLVATDRYHNEFPLSGALENWEDESPRYQNQVDFLNADNSGVLEGGTPASYQGGGLTGEGELVNPWLPEGLATSDFPARPSGIETAPFPYASSSFFEGSPSGLLSSAPKDYSVAELQALGIESGAEAGLSAAELAAQSEQALTAGEEGLLAIEA